MQRLEDVALRHIDDLLRAQGSTLASFNLPQPPPIIRLPAVDAERRRWPEDRMRALVEDGVPLLNADQRAVFNAVMEAVQARQPPVALAAAAAAAAPDVAAAAVVDGAAAADAPADAGPTVHPPIHPPSPPPTPPAAAPPGPAAFFIDSPGGCGKTFTTNLLLAAVRARGLVALPVASSGIAALLMHGGRTAHSRFKIPIDITAASVCNLPLQSDAAKLVRAADLIVWDEAPMAHKFCYGAVDKTLKELMHNELPFGGKVFVMAGDFRQVGRLLKVWGRGLYACLHKGIRLSCCLMGKHCRTLGYATLLTDRMPISRRSYLSSRGVPAPASLMPPSSAMTFGSTCRSGV